MQTALMLIWTIISYGGFDTPAAMTQTSALVPLATCEEVKKTSNSEIKTSIKNGTVTLTVKCILVKQ